ncbi:alkaline serine protease [Sporothrix brasiliensis 5110]|uniref:tripeptidyl-peptidase II n=1 Tax=Sporothrix brasiliensis 5110 TaxID=1398154 RepID=A0A0C2IHN0_9PEZI|nr:alkaline serine protease [Sporothrix brasiliensis 5110]KIH86515.1 alkaline serine protease [Sporothrix brasiliensis 5110]
MYFNTLACVALVGGLALEAAAGPVPAPDVGIEIGNQVHAVLDTRAVAHHDAHDTKHRSRNSAAHAEAHAAHNAHAHKHNTRAHFKDLPGGVFHPTNKGAEPISSSTVKSFRRMIPDTHTLHERQPKTWARRWERTERAPADALLPMRIGLKQRNVDDGSAHARLMAIADPSSASYGKHMSSKEVVDFFAPERATVDAVVGWLTSAGIHIDRITQSANKQWIQFDATVAEAEELLLAEYHVYEHGETRTRDVAAEHYHLPRSVQEHVDYVIPGIRLRHDVETARKQRRRRDLDTGLVDRRRRTKAMHTDPTYLNSGVSANKDSGGPTMGTDFTLNKPPPMNSSNCYEYVTPNCIRTQYGIPKGTTARPGNELGIFEGLNQHYSKSDLDDYFEVVSPNIPQGTYPIPRLIDGATADTQPDTAGGEAELDFQAAMPLIYPQQAVLFQVDDERIQSNMTMGNTPYLGFWNTFFDAIDGSYCTFSAFGETGNCVKPECMDPSYPDTAPGGYNGTLQCGVYEPTNVISISYGGGEADLPAYYWKRQCTEILKLGLQGVTVVISSGDDGVASGAYDGGNYDGCGGVGQIFYPASEATCPYVLAVGGTEFDLAEPLTPPSSNSTGNYTAPSGTSSSHVPKLTERATSRFGSGGGFSNYFPQPSYQAFSVAKYFSQVDLSFTGYYDMGNGNFSGAGDGVYHIGGRGFPDVSAIGDHYVTVLNGAWATIGGTSLAAPVWASVLTLVNEERLGQGKSTVGFVNPVLYQHPEVFNDITSGSNPGCGTDGFPAAEGWDPVTGLGSPDYPKLLALFKDLP